MPGPTGDNVTKTVIPTPYFDNGVVTTLLNHVLLPRYLRRQRIDVFHSTFSLCLPQAKKTKKILTIHGLGYLHTDHEFISISRKKYHQQHKKALAETDLCIAVSHHTKQELLSLFNIEPEKIRVIHLGVSDRFNPIKDDAIINTFRQAYKLPKRFILTVGAGKGKNTHGLLKAFHLLKNQSKLDHKLVIVGRQGQWTDHIPSIIEELRLSKDVIFRDYFPHDKIPLLYNASELFVFPSLFEGFGMPPLEAMRCGIPVVTSNTTTLPEIVGSGGIAVNPHDHEALAAAIEKVLTNSELYESLRKKGIKQASKFSWTETARQTLESYHLVLG